MFHFLVKVTYLHPVTEAIEVNILDEKFFSNLTVCFFVVSQSQLHLGMMTIRCSAVSRASY